MAHFDDAGDVCAIAVADEQRLRIQPYHVPGFGAGRGSHFRQHRNAESLAESAMRLCFRNAAGFSGMHEDETVVGWEGCVVRVDRIEGEICGRRQMYYVRPGTLKFPA